MKHLLLFLFSSALLSACTTTSHKIFVVRHAEKDIVFKGNDLLRPLNSVGNLRAGALQKKLSNENIQKIYVTEYLRVQQTGDSLRIKQSVDTLHYQAKNAYFFDRITHDKLSKKNILIIGHSNTVPDIIRYLGVPFTLKIIPDNEYSHLYIVTLKGKKVINFEQTQY